MRPTPWHLAEPWRAQFKGYRSLFGDNFGTFVIPHKPTGVKLRVIVSSADAARAEGLPAWDHLSASLPRRCPNWTEMDYLKRIFWADDEVAMQLHVARADHISFHPYTLHIWSSPDFPIPLPPAEFVGPVNEKVMP